MQSELLLSNIASKVSRKQIIKGGVLQLLKKTSWYVFTFWTLVLLLSLV